MTFKCFNKDLHSFDAEDIDDDKKVVVLIFSGKGFSASPLNCVYMENDDEIVVVLILLSGKGVSPEDPTYCRGKLSLAVCAC